MSDKSALIKTIYLYLFSLVGLVLVIVAGVSFIDMGLKAWVFTEAETYTYEYYPRPVPVVKDDSGIEIAEPTKEEIETAQKKQATQQRHRDAANSLAMLIVGLPLYLYHWRLATRRKEE